MEIYPCEKSDIGIIVEGINDFNLKSVPALANAWTPLEFVVKDEKGKVIGGILGGIGYWNGLEIRILWVEESFRNKGIGSLLLGFIEQQAKLQGATLSMLDTFDFQAEEFYLKKGYEKVGSIDNFPIGHTKIYFSKKLI